MYSTLFTNKMSTKVTVSFYDEKDLYDLLTKEQLLQHRKDTTELQKKIIKILAKRVVELEEAKNSPQTPIEYEYG